MSQTLKCIKDVKEYRLLRKENQSLFWNRIGLTQPAGSRYENGQPIPKPTALLIDLLANNIISEQDLDLANARMINNPQVDHQ